VNRLTAADYDNGDSYHYSYDAVGNRLTDDTPENGARTFTYDNANRIATLNGQAYTWDADGNLLNDSSSTYAYDSANRLTSLTSNGLTTTYRYNGLGDKLSYYRSDGNNRQYTLDLNNDLSQILQDGYTSYNYGLDRLGYELWDERYTYQTTRLRHRVQATYWDPSARSGGRIRLKSGADIRKLIIHRAHLRKVK
jgi:YD repeat-containing protein